MGVNIYIARNKPTPSPDVHEPSMLCQRPGSFPLRVIGEAGNPVDVRRCLFTAVVPAACEPPFIRFMGAPRMPEIPLGRVLVVAERGLLDAAILGNPAPPPLRELLPFGVPDARFLQIRMNTNAIDGA